MSLRTTLLALLLAATGVTAVAHAQRPKLPVWKQRRSALDQQLVIDEFRIYYSLSGSDALPDQVDANRNLVPDRIENISRQLVAARRLYTEVLKLRHPLESPRYKGKAKFIDVNVGALPFAPGGPKGNGSAGDAVVNYYRPSDPQTGVDVLTMDVSKTLATRNLTPAHELFHLYQYGYTMFKSGWFTEGMARWSEYVLREGGGKPNSLPFSQADREKLYRMRYEAEGFWAALGSVSEPRGQLAIPRDLRRLRYVGSNELIIRDTQFRGAPLLKEMLEALDAADDKATADYKLKPFEWKESKQRSKENYPYMWSAVIDVSRKYSSRSRPVAAMVQNLGEAN